jgi:hypothetical protein
VTSNKPLPYYMLSLTISRSIHASSKTSIFL